jgi:hypothetical protein
LYTSPLNNYTERLFSVKEVHYSAEGKPEAYGEKGNLMSDHTSLKDLMWTNKHIKKAFKKPILDGDNWPKEWKEKN